jgi:antitoxin VapB
MAESRTTHGTRARQPKATAKLFMHGRSQAVRLPKEFRFEGSEVRVSKVGDRVILEPIDTPRFDVAAWRESLRQLGSQDFLPNGRPEQPPMPEHDVSFD